MCIRDSREAAWADLKKRRKGQDYKSPIPAGAEPPVAAMTLK